MRTLARLLGRLGVVVAAVALVAAVPATASTAMPGHFAAAVIGDKTAGYEAPRVTQGAFDKCIIQGGELGAYCVYKQTDGNDECIFTSLNVSNWDTYNCRNLDESLANVNGFEALRVYYSPNFQGAWACVDKGWYSNDLNKIAYTFDNGPGDAGYGQEIWKNIASSAPVAIGTCSNPLPEDG